MKESEDLLIELTRFSNDFKQMENELKIRTILNGLLKFSYEPGILITDVRQEIYNLIEEL